MSNFYQAASVRGCLFPDHNFPVPMLQKLKQTIVSIALVGICSLVNAQAVQTKEPNYRDPVLDRQFGIIAEVKSRPAGVEGTNYLSPEWNTGTIYLKSGDTLNNFPLMYDLDKRTLEIQAKEVIKILPGEKVIAFEWQDKTGRSTSFVNSEYYTLDGTPLLGVFEVLAAGDLQLLSRIELERKKSNYNVALDVGSKADKLIKKEKLYVAREKKLTELKGKDDYSIFGDKQAAIQQFAKENKAKLSRKEDALRIIGYYNSL
ncbi:hypothetical protein Q0590_03605 [Rhodocytophaga aerolata]|uniref:Uncharacterized protein n=1 Tax=Rhodocytophaga aerolata TaxID=455078 RepID=A0ABT8QZP8_9BACT|nr:hypothetical protein [Rhodocytophaga aerolata]MDO1445319.1 hypothetical protein [Rhodocytophaga aerolata]